jgi:hypothetical protein
MMKTPDSGDAEAPPEGADQAELTPRERLELLNSRHAATNVDLTRLTPRERLQHLHGDKQVNWFFPASFGNALWDAVLAVRPAIMIAFGVDPGYTTIVAALALEEAGHGRLLAYDNWEDQLPGGPDLQALVRSRIDRYGIGHRLTLAKCDFRDWIGNPEDCDLLYLDIDNDGERVGWMFDGLRVRIERGLIVLFEGGTEARDQHPHYAERPPIRNLQEKIGYETILEDFPSLSRVVRPNAGRSERI